MWFFSQFTFFFFIFHFFFLFYLPSTTSLCYLIFSSKFAFHTLGSFLLFCILTFLPSLPSLHFFISSMLHFYWWNFLCYFSFREIFSSMFLYFFSSFSSLISFLFYFISPHLLACFLFLYKLNSSISSPFLTPPSFTISLSFIYPFPLHLTCPFPNFSLSLLFLSGLSSLYKWRNESEN